MTMAGLFDPARHEPLHQAPWDEALPARPSTASRVQRWPSTRPARAGRRTRWTTPSRRYDRFHDAVRGCRRRASWRCSHLARARWRPTALPDFTPLVATLREAQPRRCLADSPHGSASYLLRRRRAAVCCSGRLAARHSAGASGSSTPCKATCTTRVREALWGSAGTVLAAIHLAEATGEAMLGDARARRRPTCCRPRWSSTPTPALAVGARPLRRDRRALHRRRPWFCRQCLPAPARPRRCCRPIRWRCVSRARPVDAAGHRAARRRRRQLVSRRQSPSGLARSAAAGAGLPRRAGHRLPRWPPRRAHAELGHAARCGPAS